jgi:asparagine synthase (glutamine-hydrolysing)
MGGPSAPYAALAKSVSSHVKVVLTGHGGDELFCGYPKILAAAEALKLIAPQSVVRGFESQKNYIMAGTSLGEEEVLKRTFTRSSPLLQHLNSPWKIEMKENIAGTNLRKLFQSKKDPIQGLLHIDRNILLPALLQVEDRLSMASGVESRPPLLYSKVINCAESISGSLLLKNGPKSLLKSAFSHFLPEKILHRDDKSGIVYPVFLEYNGYLTNHFKQKLALLDQFCLFDETAEQLRKRYDPSGEGRLSWSLYSLGAWLSAFGVNK